jgi:hypothetical protein
MNFKSFRPACFLTRVSQLALLRSLGGFLLFSLGMLAPRGSLAQSKRQQTAGVAQGSQAAAMPADSQIAAALKKVSVERIQANIEKLVSFQTRVTLSAQDPESIAAGHGIGAAR